MNTAYDESGLPLGPDGFIPELPEADRAAIEAGKDPFRVVATGAILGRLSDASMKALSSGLQATMERLAELETAASQRKP